MMSSCLAPSSELHSSSSNNLARLLSSDDPESIKSPYEIHFSKFHHGEFEGRIDPKTAAFKLNDAFWLSDEPLTKHNKRSYQQAQHSISNHAAAPDATLEHASQAIQDSGTNANITNRKTIERLNLTVSTLKTPIVIRFGQGTIALTTEYVYLGPIIGRAYVVENAPYTLISTGLMTDKGLTVSFDRRRMTITDEFTGKALYRKNRNKKTGLYELNLEDFLTIQSPAHFDLYKSANKIAAASFEEAKRSAIDADSDISEPDDYDYAKSPTSSLSSLSQPPAPEQEDHAGLCHTCINDYASDDDSDDDYDGEIMNISSGATSSSFRPMMMQQHQRPQLEDANLSDTIVTPVIEEPPIHLSERFPIKRSRSNSRVSPSLSNRIHLLHKKMNHPGREAMAQAIQSGQWILQGDDKKITPILIRKLFDKYPCTACALAKTNKLPQAQGSGLLPDQPGHTISFDYKGPINPTSTAGYTGVFIDIDVKTLYMRETPTKSKSAEDVIAHLKETISFYRSFGWVVKYIRCDSGSETLSEAVRFFLLNQGEHPPIYVSTSPPYSQQQDPVERSMQTMIKGVGALLVDQFMLPNTHWHSALRTWVMGHNATPNTHTPESTPLQEVTHKPPNLEVFFNFPFGCPVVINKEIGRTGPGGTFQTINDFGIALGDNPNGNGSIEVLIPGKHGREYYERKNVTALPLAYLPLTSREKTALLPKTVASSDGRPESISFYSPVTSLPENPLIVPIQGSTLGNTMFGVGDTLPPKPLCAAEHAKRATSSNPDIDDRYAHRPRRGASPTPSDNVAASATLAEQEYYGPLFDPFDPLFDLDFENIPIGHLREVPPPYSSGAFAAFAGMESSSSNPLFTGAARKVHTETNPTVNQARKLINWEDWKQAILAELIALRETGTYEEIKRSAMSYDYMYYCYTHIYMSHIGISANISYCSILGTIRIVSFSTSPC